MSQSFRSSIFAMKTLVRCTVLAIAFAAALSATAPALAQMGNASDTPAQSAAKPLPSPPAVATVELNGQTITIHYNTPSMLGFICAPVAQLDRAAASEAVGQKFESSRAHHSTFLIVICAT